MPGEYAVRMGRLHTIHPQNRLFHEKYVSKMILLFNCQIRSCAKDHVSQTCALQILLHRLYAVTYYIASFENPHVIVLHTISRLVYVDLGADVQLITTPCALKSMMIYL